MTILTDSTIDTIRSTIYGIDVVSDVINAYNAANGAYARANAIDGVASVAVVAGTGLTVNAGIVSILTSNGTFLIAANTATTAAVGVIQITDSVLSSSITTAATPNAVNVVMNMAQAAFNTANNAAGNAGTALSQAAFNEANSFQSVINSAFALANTDATNITIINGVDVAQNANIAAAFSLTNSTTNLVTSAFLVANSGQNLALSAFAEANSFQSVINSSFAVTNSTTNLVTSAFLVANSGQNLALSSFAEANSFQSVINSAFSLANTVNLLTPMYDPANNVINMGGFANTRGVQSKVAYANGNFANIGDAQWSTVLLRNRSTGAAATYNLSTSGANTTSNIYGSINQIQLGNNALYAFSGTVAARDITTMMAKIWEVKGGIKNVVGPPGTTPIANVALIGTPIINIIAADNATNAWVLGVTTDLANNALLLTATGSTNTTNWVGAVTTVEVA